MISKFCKSNFSPLQKIPEIFDRLWNDFFWDTWSLAQCVPESKFTLLFICHFKKIPKVGKY